MTARIVITDERDRVRVELTDTDGTRQVDWIPNGGTRTIEAQPTRTDPVEVDLHMTDGKPEKVT